jgi:hypothetical protein
VRSPSPNEPKQLRTQRKLLRSYAWIFDTRCSLVLLPLSAGGRSYLANQSVSLTILSGVGRIALLQLVSSAFKKLG